MPFIGLGIIASILCAIHAVRTGRTQPWLWILIIAPGLGALIYIVTQILPDFFGSYSGRRLSRKVADTLNPTRERKRIETELIRADTLENRRRLAEECLRLGDFEYAETLFSDGMKGIYADDPVLLYGLARAQLEQGKGAATLTTLAHHDEADGSHRREEVALMRARALELDGQQEAALALYAEVENRIPGEEGRVRHALLLLSMGRHGEAREQLQGLLRRAEVQPKYYRREQADWLSQARQALRSLDGN
ncbi:MAG: hypothetical protein KDI48_05800 [Xanthomonadales bacterium]|nr:hypothetical protein [Xanthomonadales bacterium]